MPWTSVAKPVTPTWTGHNPQGREQYDESDIMYDDSNVFYDSIDPNQWTDVSKPTSSVWTKVTKPS